MKRLIGVLSMVLLLLIGSVAAMWFLADTRDEIKEMTEEARGMIAKQDAEALEKQAKKMSAFIEGRHPILSLYVRHDLLDTLEMYITSLIAQAESGDTDVSILLAQIDFTLNHIYERELPDWNNLL